MDKFYRFARVGVKIKSLVGQDMCMYIHFCTTFRNSYTYYLLVFPPSVGKRSYTENIKMKSPEQILNEANKQSKQILIRFRVLKRSFCKPKRKKPECPFRNFCELLHLTSKLNRPRLRTNGGLYAFEKFPFQFFEDIECLQAKKTMHICTRKS